MSTVDIHEPQVAESKPATRGNAAVLPRQELVMGPAVPARPLFSDSVLGFGCEPKRRAVATTTSLIVNCLAIALALIVPLMFTEELPKAQLLTLLVAPPPPPPPPPPPAAAALQKVVRVETEMLNGQLRTPTRIPQKVQMIKEEEAPPTAVTGGVVGGVPGGIPGGQLGGVIWGIVSATSRLSDAAVPKFAPVVPQRVRISQGVTKGLLIRRVEPTYPPLARSARVQGEVVLSAVISTNGEIENLQLVSGHPMLVPAAITAVKQWKYKPYLLNGQPTEVETTITVIFTLSS